MTVKFAWHIHHDLLVEPLTNNIEQRREFIRQYKPKHEQALRLRLLKPVKGQLPAEVVEAGKAWLASGQAYDDATARWIFAMDHAPEDARAAYDELCRTATISANKWCEYVEALKRHAKEVEALHRQECPGCPWNGRTIFSEKEDVG